MIQIVLTLALRSKIKSGRIQDSSCKMQVSKYNLLVTSNLHPDYAFTATLFIASLISFISDTSFSMALPITITSAPALQFR